MEKQIEELKKDIEEINRLLDSATRVRVQDLLGLDKRKLETELIHKEEEHKKKSIEQSNVSKEHSSKTTKPASFTVTVNTYAWDQSDKFLKIYVTLKGIQSLPKDQITSQFTNRSVRLRVVELDGKNYELYISNLLENILPVESFHKVKTDTVLLMLRKETQKTWAYVTQAESKAKESKKPKVDDNADPNESLMNMMKQMYEDGDDEMKRTISKAWSESRNKPSPI